LQRTPPSSEKLQRLLLISKHNHSTNLSIFRLIKPGGTLLCISFHSLEDRIIKRHFQGIILHPDELSSNLDDTSLRNQAEKLIRYDIKTKQIIQADNQELDENPKSRSAKLRYGIKL
jgi:16S rRNA (cytosine1402-N4)-methyltransferase